MANPIISPAQLSQGYIAIKRAVIEAGFVEEILWQSKADLSSLTTDCFLTEAAWVIMATGLSDSVVRLKFPEVRAAMRDFRVADVVLYADEVENSAISTFRNPKKISSIVAIARVLDELGVDGLRNKLSYEAEEFLQSLPYIGATTWMHLAKNVGVPKAKSDRHLLRLASSLHRESVDDLCSEISEWCDEPVPVVDIVLWRWCLLHASEGSSSCPSTYFCKCGIAAEVG
jgi:hypothetical protein